jgi:hypothetical protein
LAHSLKKPVIPFLNEHPEKITFEYSEKDEGARSKLAALRSKLEASHHCKYWSNAADLKAKAILSLVDAFNRTPMPGWIRNSGPPKGELLERLSELQARYDKMLTEYDELKQRLDGNATPQSLTENVYIELTGKDGFEVHVPLMVGDILRFIGPRLTSPTARYTVANWIFTQAKATAMERFGRFEENGTVIRVGDRASDLDDLTIRDDMIDHVSVKLLAQRLIKIDSREIATEGYFGLNDSGSRRIASVWQLTEYGATILSSIIGS